MQFYDHDRKTLADTPAYKAVERVLWFAAPVIVLFMLLNIPAMRAERIQSEEDFSKSSAAENHEYCAKWGMPEGTRAHAACIRDLVALRGRTEQHCVAQMTADF